MPKVDINYSNTIIYKISCKNQLITDIYVGYTTNFIQKKHFHKQSCNNSKLASYNLKLYKTIRTNGGWVNWEMTIINNYNCIDHLEAKQKEQENIILLNATLNTKQIFQQNDINKTLVIGNNKYNCVSCKFLCDKNSEWERHISTTKHQLIANSQQKPLFCSICNKSYKDRTGIWRHKKTCVPLNAEKSPKETSDNSDKELIKLLIHENAEIKTLILELIKKDTSNTIITNNTTNTNTNSHNKTFNLQIFLNEECKDALNLSEFVSSIKVELEDLEATGRLGYVEGVSRIMNKNLDDLDENKRPIHCSDLKREVLYIKNNDQWIKEDDTKPILKKAIKQVAFENIKKIGDWKQKHPGCTASDSRKNDLYLKIVGNAMAGITTEEQVKNIDKIVSKVAKNSVIDK
jgi:hypothetical protein